MIRIYDDFRIIVPNSQLNSKTLINTSYQNSERRGIHLLFSVSYETDVQKAMDVIRDCVAESPYTLSVITNGISEDSGPVYFLKFADSALILETTVWVNKTTSSYVVTTDINVRVNKAFKEHGIEIPYNYLNVVEFEGVKPEPVEQTVEKKKKAAPSKRHYRTNTVKLREGKTNMAEAIETAQAYAKRQGLEKHAAMQLELLTEESIGVVRNIFDDVLTNFWVEGSGLTYRIHLSFAAQMGSSEYKKLLNLSTSGKNEAVQGFAAHIWEAVLKGINSTNETSEKKDFEWSMNDDNINDDELGESILAAVANDIKVSVTREKVEFVVVKSTQ